MATFEYPAEADYGVWTRAVERVVDILELDFWPAESVVSELVEALGLTNPDECDQMQDLEDALLSIY